MDPPKRFLIKKEKYVPPHRHLVNANPLIAKPSLLRKLDSKLCPKCAERDHVYEKCQSIFGKLMEET